MKKHLPIFGIGPAYVLICGILTASSIYAKCVGLLDFGNIEPKSVLGILFIIIAIIFILEGILLWYLAVIKSKLDKNIIENKLITSGVYSFVRNPVYSAFAILFTGILMLYQNICLLILPFIFWVLLSILVKATEEKWLLAKFGDEYKEYCNRVNRCIPLFPKKIKK